MPLECIPIWLYCVGMARAATTTDAFNAIAEKRRREILNLLAKREMSVGDLVDSMEVSQPVVSKHLRVLRQVGLVRVREVGRYRMYQLNAKELRPVFAWIQSFEKFWDHQLGSVKARSEKRARDKKKKS